MQVVHKVSPREERIIMEEEDDIRAIKEKALAAIDQMRNGTVKTVYITILPHKPKR
jgi:hypothetical protein